VWRARRRANSLHRVYEPLHTLPHKGLSDLG
jgi:hypothetical protein